MLNIWKSLKPYERHSFSLQNKLESFIWSLPHKETLAVASPSDITQFLIRREQFAKTNVIHVDRAGYGAKSLHASSPKKHSLPKHAKKRSQVANYSCMDPTTGEESSSKN